MLYAFVLALVLLLGGPARADVRISIGINLHGPPPLVVVPGIPTVQYAPSVPANVFVYGSQYWAFTDGGWYVSSGYAGPWILVGPHVVPRPLLLVPVRYYRVPPPHWKPWHVHHPPRWHDEWGGEWAAKRHWKAHHDDDHGKRRDHDRRDRRRDDDGRRHGKGHDKGRGD